jgi:hypothetical protein
VTTTQKGAVEITGEIEEILLDAWHTARENLLMPSSTAIFAFVRNYSDETEALTDDQLMEFGKEVRDGFRCSKCLRLKGERGFCEWCED